jgi:small subunit ribosomal protein S6
MDEENKRVAKIKAHRDSHVKRSALPQVNAEAASVEAPVAAAAVEPEAAVEETVDEPEAAVAS